MARERSANPHDANVDEVRVAPSVGDVYVPRFTPEEESQLREKVGSKIDVAKVLGGAITLTLGWVMTASAVPRNDWRAQIAVVALLISLGLYLVTIDAYDTLLMPPVFWRPWARSFSAPLAIHHEMIRVWKRLFLPATFSLTAGLLLLVWAAMTRHSARWAAPGWLLGVGLGAGALLLVVLRIRSRPPMLGSNPSERWKKQIPEAGSPGRERTGSELLADYWARRPRSWVARLRSWVARLRAKTQ